MKQRNLSATIPSSKQGNGCVPCVYLKSKISEDFFQEKETRISLAIEAVRHEAAAEHQEEELQTDLDARFEEIAAILSNLDIEELWEAAQDRERRVIIQKHGRIRDGIPRPSGSEDSRKPCSPRALFGGRTQGIGERASWWADVNPHAIHSNLNLKMTGQLPVTRSEQASF